MAAIFERVASNLMQPLTGCANPASGRPGRWRHADSDQADRERERLGKAVRGLAIYFVPADQLRNDEISRVRFLHRFVLVLSSSACETLSRYTICYFHVAASTFAISYRCALFFCIFFERLSRVCQVGMPRFSVRSPVGCLMFDPTSSLPPLFFVCAEFAYGVLPMLAEQTSTQLGVSLISGLVAGVCAAIVSQPGEEANFFLPWSFS